MVYKQLNTMLSYKMVTKYNDNVSFTTILLIFLCIYILKLLFAVSFGNNKIILLKNQNSQYTWAHNFKWLLCLKESLEYQSI